MFSIRFQFVAAVAVLAPICWAQSPASDPAGKAPSVMIKTIDPEILQGTLWELSLADGAVLRTAGQEERRIPTDELVRISCIIPPSRAERPQLRLALRGGDVLYGRLADPAESDAPVDGVLLETAEFGRLTIPLAQLARFETAQTSRPEYRQIMARSLQGEDPQVDRILLANSDVIRGFVSSIDAQEVAIESAMGESRIALDLALAIDFGGSESNALSTPYFVVTLQSGAKVSTSELNWSATKVEALLPWGARAQVAADSIQRVDLVGGRWQWLSELRPISFQHTPMLALDAPPTAPATGPNAPADRSAAPPQGLDLDWPYVVDRNVKGAPLTVAGETFEHGVGVHSRSSLTYDLKGEYKEFVTQMGMDDDSGPYADVTAAILVDGKRRWSREHIQRGRLWDPLRIDVQKAKRIELVVDFGDNGDIQDRFNWLDAALVK